MRLSPPARLRERVLPNTLPIRQLAFAALILIALTGVLIFAVLSLVSHLLLRKWHESAIKREV